MHRKPLSSHGKAVGFDQEEWRWIGNPSCRTYTTYSRHIVIELLEKEPAKGKSNAEKEAKLMRKSKCLVEPEEAVEAAESRRTWADVVKG